MFKPGGDLYVVGSGSNHVNRYSGTTGASLGVFESGTPLLNPGEVLFGTDGNMYVTSYGSGNVLRFNGTNGAFMDVYGVGGGMTSPVGAMFDSSGALYVSSYIQGAVFRFTAPGVGALWTNAGGLDHPTNMTFMPVPEPATLAVLGCGALSLLRRRRPRGAARQSR